LCLCSSYATGSEKEKRKTEAGHVDKTDEFSSNGVKWDLKQIK
jgi:hypothetical protein